VTTAADWFLDEKDFKQMCLDAVSQAKGESAEEFAHEMSRKANVHGLKTSISARQMSWLCKIADWQKPNKQKPAP
jgi:hypothetical protein